VIIDAHAHVWPDHIASQVLATRPSGLDPLHDGTVTGLLRTMDRSGIDMACALAIANVAKNVARTNEFIGGVDRTRFIPCGTVHPELSDDENLEHLHNNGIAGVKLHPLFQDVAFGSARVADLMAALASDGIVVLTHSGAGGDEAANERGAPHHLRALIDAVPELKLVAFHFGGYHRLDEAERSIVGSQVFIETSWPPSVADLDADRIRAVIARHGPDKVVFGSDWPMTDPAAEIAGIRALGLSAEDEDAILGGNLARLLGVGAAQ
jgi:uncharacterized protein